MYCDLWSQFIQVGKLFKGGNYSRAETIRGNTVIIYILNTWQKKTQLATSELRLHPSCYSKISYGDIFFAYLLLLEQTLSLDSSKERKRKYRLVQDLTTRGQPYQLSQIGASTWAPSSGHSWKLSQCSKVKCMVNLPRKKETISHHESFVLLEEKVEGCSGS